jgi:hypothetical protein
MEVNTMGGFPFFRKDCDFDRFRGCGCGCGGGFEGCGFGRCGCDRDDFREKFKTKFFNIRGCVSERCGKGFDGGWWD